MNVLCVFVFINIVCKCCSAATTSTPEPSIEEKIINEANVAPYEITSFTLCHATEKEFEQEGRSVNSALLGYLGRSYDPLTDEDYVPIFQESFSRCSKTPDGRFYIPNGYVVEDLAKMTLMKSVELKETFEKAQQTNALNGEADVTTNEGGGSGSGEFKHTKKMMEKKKQSVFKMSGSNLMYNLFGTFDTNFTTSFMHQLQPAIDAIKKGNRHAAMYIIQKLISTYGTHVTISATIGTFFEHRAYISESSVSSTAENKVAAQGQANMAFENVGGDGEGNGEKKTSDSAQKTSFDMTIETWATGGPSLKRYFNGKQINLFDDSYPAALSKKTCSIGLLMEGGSLKESHDTQIAIRQMFDDAANEYLERNRFEGCTDPMAANFDYQATVNDNTCANLYCGETDSVDDDCKKSFYLQNPENLKNCTKMYKLVRKTGSIRLMKCGQYKIIDPFPVEGGVYQKCIPYQVTSTFDEELEKLNKNRKNPCDRLQTKNIFTKSYECPRNYGFKEKLIITYDYVVPDDFYIYETIHCAQNNTFNCVKIRAEITLRERVKISSYWCEKENQYGSIGFGGYFDPGQTNNFNGKHACSENMITVPLFHHTTFCLASPRQNKFMAELTLLYSDKTYNITCPENHSRQLITIVNFEKIYGCILKKQAYYNLDTPKTYKGPYLDERVTDPDYGRSFMILKHNGEFNEKYYLDTNGNKIYNRIKDHIKRLTQFSDKKQKTKHSQSTVEYIKNNYVIIIISIITVFCLVIGCLICLHNTKKV